MRIKGLGIRRAGRVIAERVDTFAGRRLGWLGVGPSRRVCVVGIYRDPQPIKSVIDELRRSPHALDVRLGAMGAASADLVAETAGSDLVAGKFQNLNVLLSGAEPFDWLLILDDDVTVPRGFLRAAIELCERFDFALAQPAQTRLSNANWPVAKRRSFSVARQTRFVEIGPVTLIRRDAAELLLPFPPALRFGWGLDFHWAKLMEDAGLRMGVLDAVAVVHASRKVASTYSWDAAQEEGRAYLSDVPHLPNTVAKGDGVHTYRRVPRRGSIGAFAS